MKGREAHAKGSVFMRRNVQWKHRRKAASTCFYLLRRHPKVAPDLTGRNAIRETPSEKRHQRNAPPPAVDRNGRAAFERTDVYAAVRAGERRRRFCTSRQRSPGLTTSSIESLAGEEKRAAALARHNHGATHAD